MYYKKQLDEKQMRINDFILMLIMIIAIETIYIASTYIDKHIHKHIDTHKPLELEKVVDLKDDSSTTSTLSELPTNLVEIIKEEEL